MPCSTNFPIGSLARIPRPARLVGLGLLTLLPSAAHAPSVAGNTPAALAPVTVWARGFLQPRGVVVNAQGAVFVADRLAGTVTRIAPDQSLAVVARGLERPVGLTFDSEGRLLVAEERAGRVTRLETGGGRTAIISGVKQPRWLDVADDGTLFIAARRLTRGTDPEPDDESAEPEVILALTSTGTLTIFADGFRGLRGISADAGVLYAAADGRRGDPSIGGVVFQIPILLGARAGALTVLGRPGNFVRPTAVALDRLGALLLTTQELNTDGQRTPRAVAKLHPGGRISLFAAGLEHPQGLALDSAGNLYVADGLSGRVFRFVAPPPAELDPLAPITNESSIRVRGTALPLSRLDGRVDGSGSVFTTQGGAGGGFALTIALTPNAANTIEVFATAHRGDGLTGAAAEATVRHDDVPPETAITSGPPSPTDSSTATFAFAGSDDVTPAGDLRFAWRLDARPYSEFSVARSITLADLGDGAHSFEVVARDRAGNVDPSPAARTFTVSRSLIALVEPAPGATVSAGPRVIRGTLVTGGREVAVTVNGVAAAVQGDTFAALVTLTEGTPNLQIVMTTADGSSSSQDVAVSVTPGTDSSLLLIASPRTGVGPLAVTFSILGVPPLATVEADFDGSGAAEFAGSDLDGHVFTYTQPGLYAPLVTVTDAQGRRTTAPAVVQVLDRSTLDALLQSKWTALKDALRRGDVPQALTQVSARSRRRYEPAFNALAPDLPSIDSILTDVRFLRTRGPEAIFEMSRSDAGTLKSFEVRFHVDADGFWRLRSF
jgi:sugar lactone lactonase YvrE